MMLELLPGFHAHPDRFLWHAPTATAILSDLHLGFERAIADSAGIRPDFSALTAQWQSLTHLKPKRVILAGDLFHKADLAAESVDLLKSWFAQLPAKTEIIVTPGNHDPAMRDLRLLFGHRAAVAKSFTIAGFSVAHGHDLDKLRDADCAPLIVGHQHPAVLLADRIQSVKMICFVWSPKLIVLPTFSPLPLGTTLLTEHKWILDCSMPKADQIQIAGIVRDQVLDFGPLRDLGNLK